MSLNNINSPVCMVTFDFLVERHIYGTALLVIDFCGFIINLLLTGATRTISQNQQKSVCRCSRKLILSQSKHQHCAKK